MKTVTSQFLVFALFLLFLNGCTMPRQIEDLNSKLPMSTGFYGGSILLEPWVYIKCKNDNYYIRYTYHRNNFFYSKTYKCNANELVMPDKQFCQKDKH